MRFERQSSRFLCAVEIPARDHERVNTPLYTHAEAKGTMLHQPQDFLLMIHNKNNSSEQPKPAGYDSALEAQRSASGRGPIILARKLEVPECSTLPEIFSGPVCHFHISEWRL